MSYNAAPSNFFNAGYSLSGSAISLTTATSSGTALGTFTADPTTEILTTSAVHNLYIGDVVVLSSTTTLPAGLTAGSYFVKTVPSTTTLTLSATSGGAVIDITSTGTGTHTIKVPGFLQQLTDAEANLTTGDYREVVAALYEAIYQRFLILGSSNQPTRLQMTRNQYEDTVTHRTVFSYTATIYTDIISRQVSPE